MAKARTTLLLTFEHDSTHTVHRPKFVRYATDIIRILNTYPALGALVYAGVMEAGSFNSLSSLNAKASGPLQAEAPQTWRRCAACTNDIVCQNAGGCVIQQRAVEATLAKRDAVEEPSRGTGWRPIPARAVDFSLPHRPAHRPGSSLPKASRPKAASPPKKAPTKVTKKPATKGSKKR